MALGVGSIYIVLNHALLCSFKEAAVIFYVQEDLPSFVSKRCCKFLDKVASCTWVNNLVKVAFLFKQQLLVTCYTL